VTEEQYPDPPVEAAQRLAHALLPLVSLGDTTARLVAAHRDARGEQDRQEAARQLRLLAANRAVAAAAYTPALHDQWLNRASLADLGAAWRAGHLYVDRDPRAAAAVGRVEDRLRDMHPPAMWHYDRRRTQGATPAQAMAEAARIMAFVEPHPYGPSPVRVGLGTAADAETVAAHAAAEAYTRGLNPRWLAQASLFHLGQAWQAAHLHIDADTRAAVAAHEVEKELRRMHPVAMRRYDDLRAAGHSPAAAMLQTAPLLADIDPTARTGDPGPTRRQLTVGEDPPAQADAAVHRAAAGQADAAAAAAAGTTDDPDTPATDEHAAGIQTARGLTEDADHAEETGVALLRAEMFPQPIQADLTAAPDHAMPPPASPAPTRTPPAPPPRPGPTPQ
jgi:hypothetical protein